MGDEQQVIAHVSCCFAGSLFEHKWFPSSPTTYNTSLPVMSVSNLEASETNVLEDLTKGNKKRMREHNPEEWSRHWNKIVDLSFRQGMTVQEVQTEMENHGFKASYEQQFPRYK